MPRKPKCIPLTIKLYGQILRTWYEHDPKGNSHEAYYEVAYKEYSTETGEVLNEGTEDFSVTRYFKAVDVYIWTWDGKRYNAGGKRCFDKRELVRINGYYHYDALRALCKVRYPEAALIQIRTR